MCVCVWVCLCMCMCVCVCVSVRACATSPFSALVDSSTFSPVEESDDEETIDVEEKEAHKVSSMPRTLCISLFY